MSHQRLDPLTGEWVTVSPRRLHRPLSEAASDCPFCPVPADAPEAARAASEAPDADYDVAVFENRFPALGGAPDDLGAVPPGFGAAPASGRAEVVLYSPRHDVHLPDLPESKVRLLIDVWRQRTLALEADPAVACVFVFENRGRGIGQTIGHPHGQIYGYPWVPPRIGHEWHHFARYRAEEGDCLQCALLRGEERDGRRVVDRERDFVAFVPFAARFPSEVHLVPGRHLGGLADLEPRETAALARLLRRAVARYDGLYGEPMPYMMCVYQRPKADVCSAPPSAAVGAALPPPPTGLWHMRIVFYPLLRGPAKMKYLAGSESGAGAFLLDATPEDMAAALRAVSLDHAVYGGGEWG